LEWFKRFIKICIKRNQNGKKNIDYIMRHGSRLLIVLIYVAGSRSTLNSITSVIDANFIYGSSKEMANKLRSFSGGLLKSNSVHRHKGMKDLLPPKLDDPDAGCFRPNKDTYCFMAGMFKYFKIIQSVEWFIRSDELNLRDRYSKSLNRERIKDCYILY